MNDAFEIELKVNNDFDVDGLDQVDNMRSIGSTSMKQQHSNINGNKSSPLMTSNQYLYINK